jgi:hypothetical protein
MVMHSPPPTAAALRMRIYRKRRRNRMQCISVRLHASEIDALISKGYLNDNARHDRRAVKRALEFYVCDLVPLLE